MQREHLAKVVIIGEARVGKTSILNRYTQNNFHENMIPTLGIDYRLKRLDLDNMIIKLQIWDTAGQERFRAITQNFYKGAMGIILVFDLNDPSSLENLKTWMESIRIFQTQEVVKVIFANKSDLDWKITNDDLIKISNETSIRIFIVSAKEDSNINEGFMYMAKEIRQYYFSNEKPIEESKIFELNEDKLNNSQDAVQEKKCC